MNKELRQDTRYEEIGSVIAPEICPLNGVLDDISLSGCKVHFSCIADVSMEEEYTIKIGFSRSPEEEPLQLLCKPIWVKHVQDKTSVGFSYLFSPDEQKLKQLIIELEKDSTLDMPDLL